MREENPPIIFTSELVVGNVEKKVATNEQPKV